MECWEQDWIIQWIEHEYKQKCAVYGGPVENWMHWCTRTVEEVEQHDLDAFAWNLEEDDYSRLLDEYAEMEEDPSRWRWTSPPTATGGQRRRPR